MASPEPATTNRCSRTAAASTCRSASWIASATTKAVPSRCSALQPLAHRRLAAAHRGVLEQPGPLRAQLRLQHPHEVGIGHRRERVVAHRAVGQQQVANEEVALEHRAAVLRERGRDDHGTAAHLGQQRLGHRADVAGRRAVESRADLEVQLRRALPAQPARGGQALGHRLLHGRGARLERHHDGVHPLDRLGRHADRLHHAHAGAHEVVGEVGGAGEVVGDAAEFQRHAFFSGSVMPGKILITALSSSLA